MNAVDRFRNTYSRYQQKAPAKAKKSDSEKAFEVVNQAAPLVGQLAGLINRSQTPHADGQQAHMPGPVGRSLEQINGTVKDKNFDKFVRQAAPVIDEAIPVVSRLVDLVSGKRRDDVTLPAPAPNPHHPYYGYPSAGYPHVPQHPTMSPVGYPPMPQQSTVPQDRFTQAVQGVAGLASVISGWFK